MRFPLYLSDRKRKCFTGISSSKKFDPSTQSKKRSTHIMPIMTLSLMVLLAGCASWGDFPNPSLPTTAQTTTAPIVEEPKETRVSFVGVGDNLIHETIYLDAANRAKAAGIDGYLFTPMYDNMADLIASADLAFLNQETILGGDDRRFSGYPMFNTPSVMADQMIALGFDMFNQASNHSMDMGIKGIQHAAALWRSKKNIIMSGIFDSKEDRVTPRIIEREGIRFALLSYTYGTNGIAVPEPYLVSLLDKGKIKEDVERVRDLCDIIMVSVQWGTEDTFTPNSYQKDFARYFTSLGVDVVVGHHPHTIQPVEWMENEEGSRTLVIYSLGNFISGMLDKYNALGGMIGMDFVRQPDQSKVTIENISWTPIVTHFDGNSANINVERYNYEVLPLSAYTEEMAARHALNGHRNQIISIQEYIEKTKEIIGDEITIIWD